MTIDYVLTEDVLEYLSGHSKRRERWMDTIDAGADLWVWEGAIPCNLWIFDDRVWIKKSDPESMQETYGVPIISENDAVRWWGHALIDRHRASARPIDVEAFAETTSVPSPDSGKET